MVKIGHTDGGVFSTVLQQLILEPLWGNKIVMDFPHEGAVTFSVVCADEKVVIDHVVKDVLGVMSHLSCAVGRGNGLLVEKLSTQEDEEAKYTITIKKRKHEN